MPIERKKVEVNNEKCRKEIKQVLPLKAPAQETGAVVARVHMQKEKVAVKRLVAIRGVANPSFYFLSYLNY
jgi:hypothetical protein